jgi:hypothetical protein
MKLKIRKTLPFEFVLEALDGVDYRTRAMFGCTAVYTDDKIVLVLREKEDYVRDNGVWLGTTAECHESLKKDFPSMRSIELFGGRPTAWQNLPADSPDFEAAALKACALIRRGDPRIGKVPANKKRKPAPRRRRRAG